VRDLDVDGRDAAVVAAIVGLARALNLESIAEGVETVAQLRLLLTYGCTQFQGNFFAKPQSAEHPEVLFRSPVAIA
jgi:EAL domain-containing protein (putative c-di-GMP-specific phosphodiesterase class I)